MRGKIAPRKCTKTRLFKLKNREKNSREGARPLPQASTPVGRGTPHPHTLPWPSVLAPTALVPPAFPASPPDLGVLAETLASYLETQPL